MRKSSIRSILPCGNDAVERLVDDLLDARTHVLDPARGEGLHNQPAQTGVVRRILLQHPVAHAAEHRLVHDLGAVAADGALDVILAEPLVADHEAGLGMAAADIHAERRQVHGICAAHPLVMRIGVADEFRIQRVEQRRATGSLNMLVHGDLNWLLCAVQRVFPGGPIDRNSIHYCIELHFRLNWPDVKTANQAYQGRHPRKAVRGGRARVRGSGHRRRQHRGGRGGGRVHARGVLFNFKSKDELIIAMLEDHVEQSIGRIRDLLEKHKNLRISSRR
jgi:hypothetical protein